jgi:hypothetical protein
MSNSRVEQFAAHTSAVQLSCDAFLLRARFSIHDITSVAR